MVEERESVAAEVALDLPVYETYHYLVPDALLERAQPGMRVLAPVGRRYVTGYLLRYSPPPGDIALRFLEDVLDEAPLFTEGMLELFEFAANYLFYPLGEVIRSALPAGINVESKLSVRLTEIGELAREGGVLRGPKGLILECLPPDETMLVKDFLKQVEGARHVHLRDLARDGFVELASKMSKPRARMKKARFYYVVTGVSLARRESMLRQSQRQRELLSILEAQEDQGGAFVAQLQELLPEGDLRGALRGLLKKGLIDFEEREVASDPFFAPSLPVNEKPELTPQQTQVMEQVTPGLHEGFQAFLLHGVTGSGKTEVYIRLIEKVLAAGRAAIVLVPEIGLTPQFVSHFRARLGDDLTVLHSRLSERERLAQWWRIRRGEVPLVIGARSAIFAPFADVGIIIVDEEQENSYKQEGRFPYHARSLALVRGKLEGATVILGSATPAMESYTNAQQGKWRYLQMPERVEGRAMPELEVVDLRQVAQRAGGVLSPQLHERIEQTLAAGEQCILFLNRRGYHASFLCSSCGYSFQCIHCSVSLTYHQSQGLLICHYCGYAEMLPHHCPKCRSEDLERLGLGTERVEELIKHLFPEARIARMDRDTTSRKGTLEALVQRIARREIDIVIGTQMVAKGHDFPGVTLVGVLLADMGLNLPDFRSAERSFQLLTQVSGRAGRGGKAGRVIVQTFNPHHPSIVYATQHDYEGFYKAEVALRQELGYPPFGWLVSVRIEGMELELTRVVAQEVGYAARQLLDQERFAGVVFLGPAPAPVERIKRRFRWQILFKGADRRALHGLIWEMVRHESVMRGRQGVRVAIDTDPVQML